MVYADDCDFITENFKEKQTTYKKAKEILTEHNLLINDDKTENTVVKRERKVEDEAWRNVIKLGSKLGDKEDIKRRKELATIAMNNDIWRKKKLTKLTTRIKLYETLVQSILLYNAGTWGMSKTDEKNIDSFHRKQLRQVLGIKWPHKIKNEKLYEKTKTQPLSKTITERRWKLLGHIMRLPEECPARRAMQYYFEKRTCKKFPGRKRTTIITTINRDIQRAKNKYPSFKVIPLISLVSLQNIYTKAKNRTLWRSIVKQVVDSVYSC